MSAQVVKHGLTTLIHILFGSPAMSPLGRKEFIREAFFVLVVRLLVTECVMRLFFKIYEVNAENFIGWHIFASMFILCIFLIPYFRVIHRRLLRIGTPYPALFVCLAIAIVFIYYYYSPDEYDWYWYFIDTIFFASIYSALLPWPDRSPHDIA